MHRHHRLRSFRALGITTLLAAAVERSADDAEAAALVVLVAERLGDEAALAARAQTATGAKDLAPVVRARLSALDR